MNRIVILLCLAFLAPLLPGIHPAPAALPHAKSGSPLHSICNHDGTLCVNSALRHSLVRNPLYFEVQVQCADPITLGWELRDDSGRILDQDPEGDLAFLVKKVSSTERTLAVRDFAVAPAKSDHGVLILYPTVSAIGRESHPLPGFSIPVRLDLRTTTVSFAVPGGDFGDAVTNTVEANPAHPVPMQATVDWRSTTLLYVKPAMLGGAAAESAARALAGQGPWHVVRYSRAGNTVHLTILGDGWAGVTYYLTGLDYLLEKTAGHQPGVRHVLFDRPPDFGQ